MTKPTADEILSELRAEYADGRAIGKSIPELAAIARPLSERILAEHGVMLAPAKLAHAMLHAAPKPEAAVSAPVAVEDDDVQEPVAEYDGEPHPNAAMNDLPAAPWVRDYMIQVGERLYGEGEWIKPLAADLGRYYPQGARTTVGRRQVARWRSEAGRTEIPFWVQNAIWQIALDKAEETIAEGTRMRDWAMSLRYSPTHEEDKKREAAAKAARIAAGEDVDPDDLPF